MPPLKSPFPADAAGPRDGELGRGWGEKRREMASGNAGASVHVRGLESWLTVCVVSDEILRLCACESPPLCPPSAVNWGEKSLFRRTIDYCRI